VKLYEFLIFLLQAQAQTLQRLAAFLGEEELLQLLEEAGDREDLTSSESKTSPSWFKKSTFIDSTHTYTRLESAVSECQLPAVLEFHLWAYPFYRTLIEGSLDLTDIARAGSTEELVNEALSAARTWVRNLPVSPDISQQMERIAWIPWIRFRADVLKKAGSSPVLGLPEWRSGRRSTD